MGWAYPNYIANMYGNVMMKLPVQLVLDKKTLKICFLISVYIYTHMPPPTYTTNQVCNVIHVLKF
jgi:hypothetical protein